MEVKTSILVKEYEQNHSVEKAWCIIEEQESNHLISA